MPQFMVVAVTKLSPETSHYQDIGLFEGKFYFKNNEYHLGKAVRFATGGENPIHNDLIGLVVDEKGTKVGDITLDKPYDFIWGENKQEIIRKFLHHDFKKLI